MSCPAVLSKSAFIAFNSYVSSPLSVTSASNAILTPGGVAFSIYNVSNALISFAGFLKTVATGITITITLQYYNVLDPSTVYSVQVPIYVVSGGVSPITPNFNIPNLFPGSYVAQVALIASANVDVNGGGELSVVTIATGV
jgi:hypothetical protein